MGFPGYCPHPIDMATEKCLAIVTKVTQMHKRGSNPGPYPSLSRAGLKLRQFGLFMRTRFMVNLKLLKQLPPQNLYLDL